MIAEAVGAAPVYLATTAKFDYQPRRKLIFFGVANFIVHSKNHVADFTFLVRRFNVNRHTPSAYVFLPLIPRL
jgi:hypothetical protein